MKTLLVLLALLLVGGQAHADTSIGPDGVPLRYELGRSFHGVHVGIAPGVVVQRVGKPAAYTGYVEVELMRGLVVLETEVVSQPDSRQPALWAFDLRAAAAGRRRRPLPLRGSDRAEIELGADQFADDVRRVRGGHQLAHRRRQSPRLFDVARGRSSPCHHSSPSRRTRRS